MTQQVQSFLSAAATTACNAGATVYNTAKAYPRAALAVAAGASLVAAYAINPNLFAMTTESTTAGVNNEEKWFALGILPMVTTTPTEKVTTTPTLLGYLFGYRETTENKLLTDKARPVISSFIPGWEAPAVKTAEGYAAAVHAHKAGKVAEHAITFAAAATPTNYAAQFAISKMTCTPSLSNHSLGLGRTVAALTGTVASYLADGFIGLVR